MIESVREKREKLFIIGSIKALVLTAFIFINSLMFYTHAEASVISVKVQSKAPVGERVAVDILVDPENQSINSVESNIYFSPEYLDFNGFSAKQSSIPIWIEEPKEKGKGVIHFSGVIPGGLDRLYDPIDQKNKAIPIVRLFFISKKVGDTKITIGDSSVLENNGKGTPTHVTSVPVALTISASTNRDSTSPITEDTTAPKNFTISLIERSIFGKTPRLATFGAEDTEGGIERYEVSVGNLAFKPAISPFSLPYRLFSYTLTVRAFDFSGNIQEEQITVPGDKPYGIGVAIGLLCLFLWLLRYRFYKRSKS